MPEPRDIPGINHNHLPSTRIRKLATMRIADHIQLCGTTPSKEIENGFMIECVLNYLDALYVDQQHREPA